MFRMLFRAMLKEAIVHYGDILGLSPIVLASPKVNQKFYYSDPIYGEKNTH